MIKTSYEIRTGFGDCETLFETNNKLQAIRKFLKLSKQYPPKADEFIILNKWVAEGYWSRGAWDFESGDVVDCWESYDPKLEEKLKRI